MMWLIIYYCNFDQLFSEILKWTKILLGILTRRSITAICHRHRIMMTLSKQMHIFLVIIHCFSSKMYIYFPLLWNFSVAAKPDDTVYYDYDESPVAPIWDEQVPAGVEEQPSVKQEPTKEEEQFPVIRRRSRSVGSRPLFPQNKPKSPPSNTKYFIITQNQY